MNEQGPENGTLFGENLRQKVGHFPAPKQTPETMSPHSGGTSFRGSVLGPESGTDFGAALPVRPGVGLFRGCSISTIAVSVVSDGSCAI